MILPLFKRRSSRTPEAEFWSWFERNEQRLFDFERDLESAFDELAEAMSKVHPDSTFEFSPVRPNGQREFVISAGGIKAAFPAVEELARTAPTLDRWQWVKFRPRRHVISDITFGGQTVPHDEVHYLMVQDGDRVGLIVSAERTPFFIAELRHA